MAWSDRFRTPAETNACVNWLKKQDTTGKNPHGRMINFSLCVSVTLGDKTVQGIPPLQSKQTDARLVDILITFGKAGEKHWNFRDDAPERLLEITDKLVRADTERQRTAKGFELLASKHITPIVGDYIKEQLARLRDRYDEPITQAIELYFLAQLKEQQEAKITYRSLAELREHQRMKFNGKETGLFFTKGAHGSGLFYLNSRAGDGKAIILISSSPKKKISLKYRNIVEPGASVAMSGKMMLGAVTVMGSYMRAGDAIQFTSRSKDFEQYCRSALQVTGVNSLKMIMTKYDQDAPASVFE